MWAKLDDAQLRVWQYVVNFIGKHLGRNQYDVARFLAVLYIAALIADLMRADSATERWAQALLTMVGSIATIMMFFMANSDERAAQRGFIGSGFTLRECLHNRLNRLIQTMIFVSGVVTTIVSWRLRSTEFAYFAMWGYWYVMICEPPPPPKERESVDNLAPEGA